MSRRTWYVILNALVGLWLVGAGVATVVFRLLPSGTWLMVHLLLLGALSTAIFVWSQHFADTLLRHRASGGRVSLGLRVGLHTLGALAVVAGIVTGLWPVVVAGAALIAVAAIVHAVSLVGQLRGSLPARFAPLVWYYVAAAVALVVGITLGVIMARPDVVGQAHDRLLVAHIGLNVLGWVGLTVIGTVVLLWPTVLRTKARPSSDAAAKRALPLLGAGVVLIGLACLLDLRIAVVFGILIYLVGFGQVLVEVYQHGKQSRPASFASWSIGTALGWFAIGVLGFGVFVVTPSTWAQIGDRITLLVPLFAVGFAAQILLGALSYLLPVVLGGGPEAARASARELDRASIFRIVVTNFGILLYLLPVPAWSRSPSRCSSWAPWLRSGVCGARGRGGPSRAVAAERRGGVPRRSARGAADVPRRSGMVTVAPARSSWRCPSASPWIRRRWYRCHLGRRSGRGHRPYDDSRDVDGELPILAEHRSTSPPATSWSSTSPTPTTCPTTWCSPTASPPARSPRPQRRPSMSASSAPTSMAGARSRDIGWAA